jgi:hypothetical protein
VDFAGEADGEDDEPSVDVAGEPYYAGEPSVDTDVAGEPSVDADAGVDAVVEQEED